MTVITQDDVAAFEGVLAAIDAADSETRDLIERMRRKEDFDRVAQLRRATSLLLQARRQVMEQMR